MCGVVGGLSVEPEWVAEDLHSYAPVSPGGSREDWGEVVLLDQGGPAALFATASRVRFPADPDGSIARVRGWFADRGRDGFTWYLGPHTTPADLEGRLRAHGAAEDPAEPEHTAMVLTAPPSVQVSAGLEVRHVEDYEDFCRSADVLDVGFGGSFTDDELAVMRSQRPTKFAEYERDDKRRRYLALVDGRPVAAATATFTTVGVMLLGGAATLPEARGRGAYRSLVAARWHDAVANGCRAMVTQASEMSRPIVQSVGFRPVGRIVELFDTTR